VDVPARLGKVGRDALVVLAVEHEDRVGSPHVDRHQTSRAMDLEIDPEWSCGADRVFG
jgi:hypothetical protein